ncbi:MAG: integration host factor subunit alpha [Syntrophales bacterium]|nr:integration host factor subunit alpha [Syntrophales bacterium]
MALTKAEVIKSIRNEFGFPLNRSTEIFECFLGTIKESLVNGGDVMISGFGKFCVNEKNARKGRNPQTGESIILEARKVVTFRCSSRLKDKING